MAKAGNKLDIIFEDEYMIACVKPYGVSVQPDNGDGEDLMNVSYREWKEGYGDNSSKGSKQFFTIKTESGKTFYIVVDESYGTQTAYLLTEVNENDLLNFVNYDGNSVDTGETTVYTIPRSEKKDAATVEETSDNKEETKHKKKPSYGIIIIIVWLHSQ